MTFTCLLAVTNEPSFILATAVMFCVEAKRMRVLASATPLAGKHGALSGRQRPPTDRRAARAGA